MSGKIKIFLIILALAAGFSAWSFYGFIRGSGTALIAKNLSQGQYIEGFDSDFDNDGLSNREESYWNTDFRNPDTDGDGFLDGEEVASGHDPTIPGPDDKLLKANLTDRISELTLSGLVAGSLKPGNPEYITSINLVVDEIINQSKANTNYGDIDLNIVPDSPASRIRYAHETLVSLDKLAVEEGKRIPELFELVSGINYFESSRMVPENSSYIEFIKFMDNEILKLSSRVNFIKEAQVPDYLEKEHRSLVRLLGRLLNNYYAVRNAEDDPIQALVSLNNILDIYVESLPNILMGFIEKK